MKSPFRTRKLTKFVEYRNPSIQGPHPHGLEAERGFSGSDERDTEEPEELQEFHRVARLWPRIQAKQVSEERLSKINLTS